jgi:hypothetical protein
MDHHCQPTHGEATFISKLHICASRFRHERLGNRIAKDFISHSREMRESPAWQCLPDNARRILERLEMEHMKHGGSRNGALQVSYDDFMEAGLPNKRSVALAIRQCEVLGFISVKHGSLGESSLYFLTYVNGRGDSPPATNAWRSIRTHSAAKALLRGIR